VTRGLPLSNDGKPLTNQIITFGLMIRRREKRRGGQGEFVKYAVQPKVLNEYLKGGLGRWMVPIPEIAKNDPFWLQKTRTAKLTPS